MDAILAGLAHLDSLIVDAVASPWMLGVLFLITVIDGFFPPVPSELVLLSAAAVTWSQSPQAIILVVAIAVVGAWAGDNIAYAIGRATGPHPFRWMRRGRSAAVGDSIHRQLHRRPESIILTARFVPVARVLVSMSAGAVRLGRGRFVVLSLASSAAWVTISALLAVMVGQFVTPHPLSATAIAVSIAVVAGLVIDRAVSAQRRSEMPRVSA